MQKLISTLLTSIILLLLSQVGSVKWFEKDISDHSLYVKVNSGSCATTGILDGHCTEWPNEIPPTKQCLTPTKGEKKNCNRCASTPPPSTGCDVE
jgi:hypothetical protein